MGAAEQGYDSSLIAVLGAEVNESYQMEIWRGITEEAEKHGKKLVFFMGFRSEIPDRQSHRYPFYRLARTGTFGGMIIIASAISTYLEPERVRGLFEAGPPIPKISIGLPMPGSGSVCVDGRVAMESLAEHMIESHRLRRIGLIAGPRQHPESEDRRKTLEKVCLRKGIPLGGESVYFGNFDKQSGKAGVEALWERGGRIDGLFCLNDRMALGAMEELSRRGISVPHDMPVCGFDDIEESRYCNPPLTTVSQPLYELGARSVKELYRLMEGNEPRHISLDCSLRVRKSCSCGQTFLPLLKGDRNVTPLEDLLEEETPESFLSALDRILSSSLVSPEEFDALEEAVARKEKGLEGIGKEWRAGLLSARRNIWETRTRDLISRRVAKEQRSALVRKVSISLTGSFDIPVLFRNLSESLLQLGFREAYLVLYPEERRSITSRLAFVLREGVFVEDVHAPFPEDRILPGGEEELNRGEVKSWMFTPLFFEESALGHLLLPGNHSDTEIYESLTKLVASTLRGAFLLEKVRHHEQSLQGEVRERTKELVRANKNLRKEISRRITLEEEVADISKHTMESIGQDLHDDLCQHLAGTALLVSALGYEAGKTSTAAAERAEEINRMLGDSIDRAKGIVRGLVPLGIKEEGLTRALDTLCGSLSRSSGLSIRFSGDSRADELAPERAVELYRILQEAVNNSIKHSGGKSLDLILKVKERGDRRFFEASVKDYGKGIGEGDETKGGMGLKIMKYRGNRAQIRVEIGSGGEGTTVWCEGEI